MKSIVHIAVTAALVAGASADLGARHNNDNHRHMHRHRALNVPAHVEHQHVKRETTPAVAVETKYVYSDGEAVAAAEAQKCIDDGVCVVVGTSTPKSTAKATKAATKQAAEFFESKAATSSSTSTSTTSTSTSSSSTSTSTTSSSASTSTTSTSTSTSKTSTSSAAATTSASSNSTGSGSSSEFPSGTIPCSQFPSEYGAQPLSWLGLGGWASIQTTGSWTPGVEISDIVEAISGGCTKGSFCSYACAPGQTKAQWPTTSQGSTGQSIGGLWCNDDGYLELTNPDFNTLCQDGLGGISIKNELSDISCVCGTNYPGNEMMSIPLVTEPGGTYTLTNINAKTAYQWEGKYTSGQFYVNKLGVSEDQSCVWTSTDYPDSAGNWAPVNIGAGTDINGVTYISIFPNTPTTTATLDFDIEITGDITSDCYLKSGSYYGGSSGCTTALKSGGSAVIVFKASS